MSVLKKICITNYFFRRATKRRRTLDSLPQTPGTRTCFTSLSCVNIFSFHHSSAVIKAPVWSCAQGLILFPTTKRDKEEASKMMWLLRVWLDHRLSFMTLSISRATWHIPPPPVWLSATYLALSVLAPGLLRGHTAGIWGDISGMLLSQDCQRGCVCLTKWASGLVVVKAEWSHHCVTCYFAFDLHSYLTLSCYGS